MSVRRPMSEIKAGDVVRLKSGGPLMTAGSPMVGDKVKCYWFPKESSNVLHGDFDVSVLEVTSLESGLGEK